MKIEPAQPSDLPRIKRLLEQCGLPAQDVDEHCAGLLVAKSGADLAGVVGLEVHGRFALLRSLAVAPAHRASGIARALCREALYRARAQGIHRLYLLTETAAEFFRRNFGFAELDRSSAPTEIQATREFSSLCGATARLMALNLDRVI